LSSGTNRQPPQGLRNRCAESSWQQRPGWSLRHVGFVLIAVVFGAAAVPHGQQPAHVTFRCVFTDGQSRQLQEDSFSFSARSPDRIRNEIIFDTGDGRTGRMVGNVGASEVGVLPADKATTFVETTHSGGVVITSVMHGPESKATQTVAPAVMSRHIIQSDGPPPHSFSGYAKCFDDRTHPQQWQGFDLQSLSSGHFR
jgi:hypothetical protein